MNQMMKMKHGKQMPESKNRRLALEETKNDASLRLQSSKPELDSGTFDFRERDRISYNFSLLFCLFIDLKSTRQWHHGHHGTLCTKSFALIHELHQKKKKKKNQCSLVVAFFLFSNTNGDGLRFCRVIITLPLELPSIITRASIFDYSHIYIHTYIHTFKYIYIYIYI